MDPVPSVNYKVTLLRWINDAYHIVERCFRLGCCDEQLDNTSEKHTQSASELA